MLTQIFGGIMKGLFVLAVMVLSLGLLSEEVEL